MKILNRLDKRHRWDKPKRVIWEKYHKKLVWTCKTCPAQVIDETTPFDYWCQKQELKYIRNLRKPSIIDRWRAKGKSKKVRFVRFVKFQPVKITSALNETP